MQIIFLSGTKCLCLAQYVNKFLVRHKKFGPAQNILQPVKGQGITYSKTSGKKISELKSSPMNKPTYGGRGGPELRKCLFREKRERIFKSQMNEVT